MSRQEKSNNTGTTQQSLEDVNPFAPWSRQEVVDHHEQVSACLHRAEQEYEQAARVAFADAPHPLRYDDITGIELHWLDASASAFASFDVEFRADFGDGVHTLSVLLPQQRVWRQVDQVFSRARFDPKAVTKRWWQRLMNGRLIKEPCGIHGSWLLTRLQTAASERAAFMTIADGRHATVAVRASFTVRCDAGDLKTAAPRLEKARQVFDTSALLVSVASAPDPCDAFVSALCSLQAAELPRPETPIPRRCLWDLARSGKPDLVYIAVHNPATDTASLLFMLHDRDCDTKHWALSRLIDRFGSAYVELWDPESRARAVLAAACTPFIQERLDFGSPWVVDGILCDRETGVAISA